MRILLAEDDADLGLCLCRELKKRGVTPDWIREGQKVLHALEGECGYEVLVLDLGLPGLGGLQVLASLRARRSPLPVIVISANNQVESRIATLSSGADDYLTKPFDVRELLARIQAVVRRRGGMPGPVLSNGEIELNPQTHEVQYRNRQARLSAREYDLLHALLIRPGAILARRQLEERVYGWGQEVDSNAVEFLIHAVRQKLGKSVIGNVRGIGWYVNKGP